MQHEFDGPVLTKGSASGAYTDYTGCHKGTVDRFVAAQGGSGFPASALAPCAAAKRSTEPSCMCWQSNGGLSEQVSLAQGVEPGRGTVEQGEDGAMGKGTNVGLVRIGLVRCKARKA